MSFPAADSSLLVIASGLIYSFFRLLDKKVFH